MKNNDPAIEKSDCNMSGGEWDYKESWIRMIGESESMQKENPMLSELLVSLYEVVVSTDLRICGDIEADEASAVWEFFCKKWGSALNKYVSQRS